MPEWWKWFSYLTPPSWTLYAIVADQLGDKVRQLWIYGVLIGMYLSREYSAWAFVFIKVNMSKFAHRNFVMCQQDRCDVMSCAAKAVGGDSSPNIYEARTCRGAG
jgi:TRAP-type mannitol/chloroaromatic compound transport system permease large subunit